MANTTVTHTVGLGDSEAHYLDPTAHALVIGTDVVTPAVLAATKLDDLAAPDNNTDLNASTTKHGLMALLANTGYKYWRDDGTWQEQTLGISFAASNGATAIATGVLGDLYIPFACVVTGWTLLADQSGSIVIDVWKDSYANYPPTDADAMPGAGKEPTIATAVKGQNLSLSWDVSAVAAGSCIRFNVDSCTDITRVTINLTVRRAT